jgi:hypothetical protein
VLRSLAAIGALTVLAIACSKSPTEPSPTPLTVSLASSAWETISDPQPFALANQGSALTFDFPATGSINYMFTPSTLAAIHGTLAISITVTTSGPVIFNSLDPQTASCSIPSSVRPFLWANQNGDGAYDRWWSNPRAIALAAGTNTLRVPLRAENWSSVEGKFGSADAGTRFGFDKALLNVTRLGLTFGGGCSFGHGINIRGGTASFALTQFMVQ